MWHRRAQHNRMRTDYNNFDCSRTSQMNLFILSLGKSSNGSMVFCWIWLGRWAIISGHSGCNCRVSVRVARTHLEPILSHCVVFKIQKLIQINVNIGQLSLVVAVVVVVSQLELIVISQVSGLRLAGLEIGSERRRRKARPIGRSRRAGSGRVWIATHRQLLMNSRRCANTCHTRDSRRVAWLLLLLLLLVAIASYSKGK